MIYVNNLEKSFGKNKVLKGVNELMFAGKVVVGSTYLGLEPYIVAAVFYFIMTFTLGRIISLIERRMKKSDSR